MPGIFFTNIMKYILLDYQIYSIRYTFDEYFILQYILANEQICGICQIYSVLSEHLRSFYFDLQFCSLLEIDFNADYKIMKLFLLTFRLILKGCHQ